MEKIKLISDSTCDLTDELLKKHRIDVVPLYINFSDVSYFDGVDLNVERMYEVVDEKKELPKTAAPSPGAFHRIFEQYLEEGYKILYIGVGTKFSATFASANTAKVMLESDDIYLVDSLNLSSGSGLLLMKAAEMIEQGLKIEEIKANIEAMVPKLRAQFVIETLEYLYKGGRLNALSALMGSMLKIKPIIKVRDGVMVVGKKGRGNIRKAIDLMLEEIFQEKAKIDPEYILITHSLAHDSYLYIKERLEKELKIVNLLETAAGCSISSHCGKGTIGVLYLLK